MKRHTISQPITIDMNQERPQRRMAMTELALQLLGWGAA
jgi:hypothetical protein